MSEKSADSKSVDELWSNADVDALVHFLVTYATSPTVEIEARLGLLWVPHTKQRFSSTTTATSVVSKSEQTKAGVQFLSGISMRSFQHLNNVLNERYRQKKDSKTSSYSQSVETDRFYYALDQARVTTDSKGRFLRSIRKTRLADLEVRMASGAFDFRISASTEEKQPIPKTVAVCQIRQKNRLSYRFDSLFSIDLTQVSTYRDVTVYTDATPVSSVQDLELDVIQANDEPIHTYELELEFVDMASICAERQLYLDQKPNGLREMATSLLDSLRLFSESCHSISTPTPTKRPIVSTSVASAAVAAAATVDTDVPRKRLKLDEPPPPPPPPPPKTDKPLNPVCPVCRNAQAGLVQIYSMYYCSEHCAWSRVVKRMPQGAQIKVRVLNTTLSLWEIRLWTVP